MKQESNNRPPAEVLDWFIQQGFQNAEFVDGRAYLSCNRKGRSIFVKLQQRKAFHTLYREAQGGSFLVFEVNVAGKKIQYTGYCPICFFGIKTLNLPFKEKAISYFPYRREGYKVEKAFQQFLKQVGEEVV